MEIITLVEISNKTNRNLAHISTQSFELKIIEHSNVLLSECKRLLLAVRERAMVGATLLICDMSIKRDSL